MIKKKVVVYTRVSKFDQNIENQKIAIDEYLKNRPDLEVVGNFEEKISGIAKERPEMEKILKLAFSRKFNILLVWKFDRLGRSVSNLALLLEKLHNYNIDLISITEQIDTTTPLGVLYFNIASAFAQLERSLISERTKAGLERAKSLGIKLGRPKKNKNNT